MKRRNADTGKMRRPVKRTKITEGMYGSSMLYLKFVMVWAAVLLADYMLEFRFEFLWPFWMMLRSVYDSFKYQGLAFSVFFICIALTSDMICFFFIPIQYIFFAASTYVWVQYVWYTFADKGICVPTVAICCVLVYVEGAVRGERGAELCRPLAAHCVGYPAVTLGIGVNAYVGTRLRLRKQRQVRAENEFYFQLMRDAVPETALEQNQQTTKECDRTSTSVPGNGECAPHMNGSLRRKKTEPNGLLHEHNHSAKLDKVERQSAREKFASTQTQPQTHAQAHAHAHAHAHSNGAAAGAPPPPAPPAPAPAPAPPDDDIHDKQDHSKGSAKSSKCEKKEASTLKEEKKKNKNKDKDKDNHSDSHKGTEQTKEQIVKEVESTKENHIKNQKEREHNSSKERERDREREREKERERERERERELKEKEKERERERELRSMRGCAEELRRVRAELATALRGEAEARRALAAAAAAERQAKHEHSHLRHQHQQLQHKVSAWRSGERAALERRLGEERRARTQAEHQLRSATAELEHRRHHTNTPNGECESEVCRARHEAELCALRRDLLQAQRDLSLASEQVRSLGSERCSASEAAARGESRLAGALAALQERAAHLERALSAETRVKLDLLQALGDAKRQLAIQEGVMTKQEKEIEELKAQMLAVMPTEYVTSVNKSVSKLRLENSALDPNASVYTPKQLCSDA